jgi:hypothetical protein
MQGVWASMKPQVSIYLSIYIYIYIALYYRQKKRKKKRYFPFGKGHAERLSEYGTPPPVVLPIRQQVSALLSI